MVTLQPYTGPMPVGSLNGSLFHEGISETQSSTLVLDSCTRFKCLTVISYNLIFIANNKIYCFIKTYCFINYIHKQNTEMDLGNTSIYSGMRDWSLKCLLLIYFFSASEYKLIDRRLVQAIYLKL